MCLPLATVVKCTCACMALLQCIARDVDGKREVAGVHWDYDCYGAPGKVAQVRACGQYGALHAPLDLRGRTLTAFCVSGAGSACV